MLTAERLRERLHYDPLTGVFTWLVSPSKNTPAGTVTATARDSSGYFLISVDWRRYKAHRLAWLYMTGQWPKDQIDHRDGNPENNIWTNLREATTSQNKANMGKMATNTSGYKGVRWYRWTNKWAAQIGFKGHAKSRTKHLGYFNTREEAHAAYCEAARSLFGEFARTE